MSEHEADLFTPSYWVQAPHRFSWRSLGFVARRTISKALEVDTSIRCAGVAFFSFLSLFPTVAAAVAIYALFSDPNTIDNQFLLIAAVMPGDVVELLRTQVDVLVGRETELGLGLAVSLLLTLWTGSRGVNALIHAITRAHLEADERGIVHGTLLSIVFTIGVFALAAVLTTAVALVPIILSFFPLAGHRQELALWLRWPVVAVIVLLAFMVLFMKAPHRKDPKKRWVIPGALVSTVFWITGSLLFSYYIENFANYNATFGSIAATAVLMLWLYVSAFALVVGAILNAQLEYQTGMDTTRGPPAPRGERGAFVADHIAREDRKLRKAAEDNKPPIPAVPMNIRQQEDDDRSR